MKGLEALLIWVAIFGLSFSGCYSKVSEDDVRCLQGIKQSFSDPAEKLSNWDFKNTSVGNICKFVGVTCWNDRENRVLNLEFRDMKLSGKITPALGYCGSLQKLDLGGNDFSGTIPSQICDWVPFITTLDLSSNGFSGSIPPELGKCSYLNELVLSNNHLSGTIPYEIASLGRLKVFSVESNLLSGEVPDFKSTYITAQSYAENSQLCGRPLDPCHNINPFKVGFEIGYLVSATTVFLSLSVYWLQVKMIAKGMVFSVVGKLHSKEKDDQLLTFPTLKHQKEISQLEKMVHRMSFPELCKATDNFSMANVIGKGKTGTMYKATLPNGWFLAVKKIDDSPHNESLFVSELLALARMKHDNLISLLGFCMVENERLLVYKHMSNGNLHDCLHRVEGDAKILQWPLRVKIGMGIARGLAWLHHKCVFRVVHRRINSSCVLLDRYYEPKISNFGHAIISNYGGVMFVYPNENDSGMLVNSGVWETDFVKKDVYDWGTVLLELITGKETGSCCVTNLHDTLAEWINHISTSPGILNDVSDNALDGQGYDGEILDVLKIARDCVHPVPCKRPTMLKVYERLSNIGLRYGIPCDFGLLLHPKRS